MNELLWPSHRQTADGSWPIYMILQFQVARSARGPVKMLYSKVKCVRFSSLRGGGAGGHTCRWQAILLVERYLHFTTGPQLLSEGRQSPFRGRGLDLKGPFLQQLLRKPPAVLP